VVFNAVAVLSLFLLFLALSIHRYRRGGGRGKSGSEAQGFRDYVSWLRQGTGGLLEAALSGKWRTWWRENLVERYPPKQRWIIAGLAASFLYQAGSGFFSAIFPLRLSGIFLLFHVLLGAAFAVLLAAAAMLRVRFYAWPFGAFEGAGGKRNLSTREGERKVLQIVCFWAFLLFGLVLILSALAQMVSFFSLAFQIRMLGVHRAAALGSLLSAGALFNFSFLEQK